MGDDSGGGEASSSQPKSHYASHWGAWFKEHRPTEWHCSYQDIAEMARPYLLHSSGAQQAAGLSKDSPQVGEGCVQDLNYRRRLIDLGCGQSQLGREIFRDEKLGFTDLILLDIVPDVVDSLTQEYVDDTRIECKLCDVTKGLPYSDGCVAAILDKGTMDALDGDDDKIVMLRECSRVLDPTYGVLLSISFGSVLRLQLLDSVCARDGLFGGCERRTYLIGDKDPLRGYDVRFLTVFGYGLSAVQHTPSDLTKEVLRRIQKTGSMYVSEEDYDQEQMMGEMLAEAAFHAAIS